MSSSRGDPNVSLRVNQLRHVSAALVPAGSARCDDPRVMTKEEYLAHAEEDDGWAPGWLAIDSAFEALYPGVTPLHLGTDLAARAMFGGEDYIDGISLFPSPNGYQHLVTYGMSKLYVDEEVLRR